MKEEEYQIFLKLTCETKERLTIDEIINKL